MAELQELKQLLADFDKEEILENIEAKKDFKSLVGIVYILTKYVNSLSLAKGIDGKNYVLTEKDKKQIATSVKIPIVEKIVETIIEKQPIVTNEIKEVAVADTPEVIKEKLDSIDYLDELKKEIDKMKKRLDNQSIRGGGAGPTGGHVVKVYDISASLDGLTKTFSLPAFWRVISVQSSSLPFVFRPIIDYTVDGSAFTITFTSEITAGTTLAAGQSVVIIYSE